MTVLWQKTVPFIVYVYKKQQKKKYPTGGVCTLKKNPRMTKKGLKYKIKGV